jgi:DNA-binding response OmpR family regulator
MAAKILLVDDEKEFVDMIKMRLEAKNYAVITAHDGIEALNKTRELRPDLIILDIMLPNLDGYQICRMIKFDKTFGEIPIILLTALDQEKDRKLGEQVRADAYITKPFEPEELVEKIAVLLRKNE